MKVTRNEIPEEKKFHPFSLTLEVESEEEARALYAIFNYVPNCELLENNGHKIREAIGSGFSTLGEEAIIARGVKYSDFYRSKF